MERLSYDVMTPSAARGILEAIYWKPEIRWRVQRITTLAPIRFETIRRNEIQKKIPTKSVRTQLERGVAAEAMVVEEVRTQRATTMLRDVDYVIDAQIDVVGGADPVGKHLGIFERRARNGQCFHRPCLGCREFVADFAFFGPNDERPVPDGALAGERDLGWMLFDLDYGGHAKAASGATPLFFRARMIDGVIEVPPVDSAEVRR